MMPQKMIVIAGPTASGKSGVAIDIAREYGGEVVNADSLQLYRLMDIGTAKPTLEERGDIPHHMLDLLFPDEAYNAAKYGKEAEIAIKGIYVRGKIPVITGGCGLYIQSILKGIFPGPSADDGLRDSLQEIALRRGKKYVHQMLEQIDPVAASRIHPNNLVRVIRAIEVFSITKKPISSFHDEMTSARDKFSTLRIGILWSRDQLRARINRRVDEMVDRGFKSEVEVLLQMGYDSGLRPMRSIGYKEMCDFIEKRCSFEDAVAGIKSSTHRYAKKQMTWFRREDGIIWYRTESAEMQRQVSEFLS